MRDGIGSLNQRIEFCEDVESGSGGLPGRPQVKVYYSCWARVEEMKQSDIMTSLNEQSKITIAFFVRDPLDEYEISNHHYVRFRNKKYPIEYRKTEFNKRGYMRVYCTAVS